MTERFGQFKRPLQIWSTLWGGGTVMRQTRIAEIAGRPDNPAWEAAIHALQEGPRRARGGGGLKALKAHRAAA